MIKLLPIVFILFVGCKKENRISDVSVIVGDSFNGQYPSLTVSGKIAEYTGRLDSSGLVYLNESGKIIAMIHDVGTWFRIAVNRPSSGPYVTVSDEIVQYHNFYGNRPYYIVVCN